MSETSNVATTIAKNLLRIRVARGLKQHEVAKRAGLSRGSYVLIETGQSIPRAETLRALAKALDTTLAECVTPVRELRSVRFRSQKKFRLRDQVLADVSRKLRDYRFLEDLLGDTVGCQLLPLPPDEPERLAGVLRPLRWCRGRRTGHRGQHTRPHRRRTLDLHRGP